MTWLNKARIFKVTVTVAAVLAWFTGTNHCWLGRMNEPGNAAVSMSHCPDHSENAGGSDDASSRMSVCCQGLQSANFELAKAKVVFSPVLVPIQFFAISQQVPPGAPEPILLSVTNDAGPPVSSFVRTVLGRSLSENGPPLRS